MSYPFKLYLFVHTRYSRSGEMRQDVAYVWKQLHPESKEQNELDPKKIVSFEDREQMLTHLSESGLLSTEQISTAHIDIMNRGEHQVEVLVPSDRVSLLNPPTKAEPGFVEQRRN